jgi:uncharacterized membrane protein HdeD (DUF308 family)
MWFASGRTLVLRGLVTIAFGLLLILRPAISLELLVLLFGAFALVEGALALTAAGLATRGETGRGVAFVAGASGVGFGIITFLWPGVTQVALLILIALRALVIGVAELALAAEIARQLSVRSAVSWLFASAGLLSLAFGALLLLHPRAGLVALVWVVGLYAVMLGILLIAKAWLLTLSSHTPVTTEG